MSQNAIADDFLFESLHGALTFAYRYSGQQYSPSIMAQLMRGPMRSGKGLSGLDGAAQAGLIRGLMQNLDPHERHMIEARYAMNEGERLRAMLYFMPVIIASMPTGVHSKRAADVLIQRWFGQQRLNSIQAGEQIGCHRNTVTPMWTITKKILKGILERAEESAYRELHNAGIIS